MLVINCPMFETVNLPVKAYILWEPTKKQNWSRSAILSTGTVSFMTHFLIIFTFASKMGTYEGGGTTSANCDFQVTCWSNFVNLWCHYESSTISWGWANLWSSRKTDRSDCRHRSWASWKGITNFNTTIFFTLKKFVTPTNNNWKLAQSRYRY